MSISGASGRADLRYNGILKLLNGPGGIPPATNGIAIDTAGNVGIGTTSPTSKLEIVAQDGLKIRGFQPFLTLSDANAGNKSSFMQSANGDVFLLTDSRAALVLKDGSGNVGIGTTSPTAKFHVIGTTRTSLIQVTGGSDVAENFEFAETVKPGMVVAIDPLQTGKLVVSRGVYNRRVAGIISGANNLSAGMTLPDLKNTKNSQPV